MTDVFRSLCIDLVRIADAVEGGNSFTANQCQAVDGFSALANFRALADTARKKLAKSEQPESGLPSDGGYEVGTMWAGHGTRPETVGRPVWTEGVCGDGAAILKNGVMQPIEDVIAALNAAELAQSEADALQISDGYHTFAELYEHRHALCLALMRAMPHYWWFSRRHADGEPCFGGNDWFIVGADLPGLDDPSVTYHLPMRLWEAAQATGAQELPKGRPWDGHGAQDVVDRLMLWAALPQSEVVGLPPRVGHILRLSEIIREVDGSHDKGAVALAEAILSHPGSCWGRPAIAPISVSERKPEEKDCTTDRGECWHWQQGAECWELIRPPENYCVFDEWTHWLPHWALPIPATENIQ